MAEINLLLGKVFVSYYKDGIVLCFKNTYDMI